MESDKTAGQKSAVDEDKDEDFIAIKEERSRSEDEIVKELKNVKRQNTITHCLLTAMILVTLTWQVSEVSLILKVKQGLKNPFKSVGGLLMKNFLPKPPPGSGDAESSDDAEQNSHPLPLKLPDFLGFDTSDDD